MKEAQKANLWQSILIRLCCRAKRTAKSCTLIGTPPERSISEVLGAVKRRTAIRVFKQFPYLKKKPYWGNHFWAKGYCVDTVGVDAEMIRKYVKYQEKLEKQHELKF
nr:IS200/IS605 family transposase [Psychromonas hadalis]